MEEFFPPQNETTKRGDSIHPHLPRIGPDCLFAGTASAEVPRVVSQADKGVLKKLGDLFGKKVIFEYGKNTWNIH